jgi:hypothetical protein
MARFTSTQTKETDTVQRHTDFLSLKINIAASAYSALKDYNFNLSGQMPNFSWTTPTSRAIAYDSSAGELQYNSTGWSSLSSEDKAVFFRWLPHFMRECLKNYDITYGL